MVCVPGARRIRLRTACVLGSWTRPSKKAENAVQLNCTKRRGRRSKHVEGSTHETDCSSSLAPCVAGLPVVP